MHYAWRQIREKKFGKNRFKSSRRTPDVRLKSQCGGEVWWTLQWLQRQPAWVCILALLLSGSGIQANGLNPLDLSDHILKMGEVRLTGLRCR